MSKKLGRLAMAEKMPSRPCSTQFLTMSSLDHCDETASMCRLNQKTEGLQ